MQTYSLKKGLDLPIAGAVENGAAASAGSPDISMVGLLGADIYGLKPRMAVEEGDVIAAGAPVFAHKDVPQAQITAPVSGRIKAINRGRTAQADQRRDRGG